MRYHQRYYPNAVALEVALVCNMRCLHCGSYATNKNRKNPLSLEEWYRVVDDLIKLKTKHFTLSGGEPFLYKHWRELITYIRNHTKKEINLISNGTCITENDFLFLKKINVSHIGISLDGDEKTHDYIRQYPGAFKKIIQTFQLAKKNNFLCSVVTCINKKNFAIRNKILRTLLKNGIKYWQVQIVNSFGRAGEKKNDMLISGVQYARLVEDLAIWKKTYKKQIAILTADSIGYCHPLTDAMLDGAEWQGCNAGKYVLGIESNGDVKGCLSLQDNFFVAGNVRERSLIDMWKDDNCFAYTRKYNPKFMQGACQGCKKAKQCMAGCLGIAYSIHGTIYENSYCYRNIMAKKGNVNRRMRSILGKNYDR